MSRRSRMRGEESRSSPLKASLPRSAPGLRQSNGLGNSAVAAALQEQMSGGQALDPATRTVMEAKFGAHFGDVRVHAGAQSDDAARNLSARAFTSGRDIGFRSGMYDPRSVSGRGLLAHELAHVLQQRGAASRSLTSNRTGSLESEARGAARAAQADAPGIAVAQPAAAPALQCDLLDYVPGAQRVAALASDAFDMFGRLNPSTINGAVERVLTNRVLRGMLLTNPALAPHAVTLDFLAAHPGALQAIWSFALNPQPKIDELEEMLRPHILSGVAVARTQSEELLRGLGVPEPHVVMAGRVLQSAASFALAAAEFVIDDVIVDTIAFHQLRSERESYNEAWQKYEAGLIDTHDIVVEHLSFALSVLGRIEDIVSVILWVAGMAGGGAVGGTVGSVVPAAGTAAGAGGGGAAGAAAGWTASEIFGVVATLGPAAVEVERMVKSAGDLLLAEQTEEQRNEDYAQIASGAVTLAVMAVLAFLPGLAMRLGRRLARRIRRMLPEISSLLPAVRRALPTPPATRAAPPRQTTVPPTSSVQPAGPVPSVTQAERPAPGARAGEPARVRAVAPGHAAPAQEMRREAGAPNVEGRPPAGPAAPRSNVHPFPAERARPAGARVRETPGELVEGPWRRPGEPQPPNEAVQRQEVEIEELRTGTGDIMYQETGRPDVSDVPRAMAGQPTGAPPTTGTPGVAIGASPRARLTARRGGGRRGGPPSPGAPTTARQATIQLLGRLHVADRRIDAISDVEARAILALPRPPANERKARDIWDYLRYKYRSRRRAGTAPWPYRRWSRSHGLRQEQRAARRAAQGPPRRSAGRDRRQTDAEREATAVPEDPSPRTVAQARELMTEPRELSANVEELGTTRQLRERVPGTNMDREAQVIMDAGTALEAQKVELWRRQLRRYRVLTRDQFQQEDWLQEIFPGRSRPDFVAIGERDIIVGDIEARPDPEHWEKTIEYAQRLIAGLPEEFAAHGVIVAERFWQHGYGHRTLRRIIRPRRRR